MCFFFFFQAADGIRDATVTGVQTCALPIWKNRIICHTSSGVESVPSDRVRSQSHPTHCVALIVVGKAISEISSERMRSIARNRVCSLFIEPFHICGE